MAVFTHLPINYSIDFKQFFCGTEIAFVYRQYLIKAVSKKWPLKFKKNHEQDGHEERLKDGKYYELSAEKNGSP